MAQTDSVANAPELVRPLLNGMKIPALTLRDSTGAAFDLTSSIEARPAIVVFYRGGW